MNNAVIDAAICKRIVANNPEHELDSALIEFSQANCASQLLAIDFDCEEYWRDEKSLLPLTAIYRLQRQGDEIEVTATAITRAFADRHWENICAEINSLDNYFAQLGEPLFDLNAPIRLQPIAIPKPWGQEIWYTGIEKRGMASVGEGAAAIPLPWLLAIAPQRLSAGGRQPILLKILDPLAAPEFGDLYFELHQEKQEVYIVTAVDRSTWPDGTGAIRFGFNTRLRSQYRDDRRFVADYLNAVARYREVRRDIDAQLDTIRQRERVGLNDPVAAPTLRRWLDEIPTDLHRRERTLREAMEAFTALRSLTIGDVVKVPCLVPHSLQHGVRTVEFQTPVYERLILSFAQKVLTQSDWDTERAAELLQLDPPAELPFPKLTAGDGWVEQQIVRFDDFEVRRITLQPDAIASIRVTAGYGLGMIVGSELMVNGQSFAADTAALLPGAIRTLNIANTTAAEAYFLLALPLV